MEPTSIQPQPEPTFSQNTVPGERQAPSQVNLYTVFRRVFFIGLVLLAVFIVVGLIYANGKSIYDNGL